MLHGYSGLADEDLMSFEEVITGDAPWKDVPGHILTDEERENPHVMMGMRVDQALKSMLLSVFVPLKVVFADEFKTPKQADMRYDTVQRLIDLDLQREELGGDPRRVAAARHLRKVLLEGGGTAHTMYEYADEVAFGGKQVALLQQPTVVEALTLLGMTERMNEAVEATRGLAVALGKGGKEADKSRYRRLVEGRRQAVAVLNHVHNTLVLWRGQAKGDAAKRHFDGLLKPFLELLDRAEPAAQKPAGEEAPAAAASAVAPGEGDKPAT